MPVRAEGRQIDTAPRIHGVGSRPQQVGHST